MKYISRIFRTGAVRETPEKIIQKILSEIDLADAANILEFGAGKGEITQPLARHITDKRRISYYAFEIDQEFSRLLQSSLPNIRVLSEDAFQFEKMIPGNFSADYIISSMPLSFYPKADIIRFLKSIRATVREKGKILILFHAFWLIPLFKKEFKSCRIHRFNTFPPYFLLVYTKKTR
jgi:phospholipid N-methyltransferase